MDFKCEMLLYLNILVSILALSSPVPLTTPSRGCPTCKTKPTQTQASQDSNTTAVSVGEPCGVYTLSCAQGLRCAPPQGEPRPLRALLEGRGVCSNASSISPTENILTAGKRHTHCAGRTMWMRGVTQADGVWIFNTHHLLIYLPVFTSLHFRFNQQTNRCLISCPVMWS